MISKISNLFIWWNGQTIGTTIYTKFFGIFVGKDEYGNNYFKSSDGRKRWVNYKGACDASNIPPAWHSWIHKTTNKVPSLEENNHSNLPCQSYALVSYQSHFFEFFQTPDMRKIGFGL